MALLGRSQVYPPKPWDVVPLEVHFDGKQFMLTTPQGYGHITHSWYPGWLGGRRKQS